MKKKISLLLCIFFICNFFASAGVCAKNIVCITEVIGNRVNMTGKLEGDDEARDITLLVGDESNILWIDQTRTDNDGNFLFSFPMAYSVPSGEYTYRIGADTDVEIFEDTFEYESEIKKEKFADINLSISIENYVPIIEGCIIYEGEKEIDMSVKMATVNYIENEAENTEEGKFYFSYGLHSFIFMRDYDISLECKEGDQTKFSVDIEMDGSPVLTTISADITTVEDVSISADLSSPAIETVNKHIEVQGNKNFNVSLPNILPNVTYTINAQAYEIRKYRDEEQTSASYTKTSSSDEEFMIVTKVINFENLADAEFELTYNPEEIILTDIAGLYPGENIQEGVYGDVEILSLESGRITFKKKNIAIPINKAWSGVLNVFKFKFISENGGETAISLNSFQK